MTKTNPGDSQRSSQAKEKLKLLYDNKKALEKANAGIKDQLKEVNTRISYWEKISDNQIKMEL